MKKISDEIFNKYMEEVEEFFKIVEMGDFYLRKNAKDEFHAETLAKTARQISAYFPRLAVVTAHYEAKVDAEQARLYCDTTGNTTDRRMYAIAQTAEDMKKARIFSNLLKWSDKLVDALKKEAGILSGTHSDRR